MNNKDNKPHNIHLAKWLLAHSRGYKAQAVLNTTIGLVLVAADLAFVWATKLSVDIATGVEHSMALWQSVAILVSIIIVQLLLGMSSKWVKATLGVKSQNKMQLSLFSHLMRCRWKEMRQYHSGDLLNRIEQDVREVTSFITESIPSFATTFVKLLGAFAFLFVMDSTLACVIIMVVPFFILCSKLYMKKMRRLTHEVRSSESRIQATIQETLQHAMVIKALGREQRSEDRLANVQAQLRGQVVRKAKYSITSSTIMNLGFSTGYLITFIWGITSLQQGVITYGAMIAFIQLVGQIQTPVRGLTKFVPVLISAFTAAERLEDIEHIPREPSEADRPLSGAVGIRFENITYSYEEDSKKVLNDFSFDIRPRSITAIVGETGAGKTTLIRLAISLLECRQGKILLYNDRGETVAAGIGTRCNFSYVPQGNTLLSGTIRDNLLMGNPSATEQEMVAALKMASADFVLSLPKGLDSPCQEMGGGLSEGQAQRISIARALLKNAPILLLDEATSSLDAATEKAVIGNIVAKCSHKTVIFITHRPEVLKYATQTISF